MHEADAGQVVTLGQQRWSGARENGRKSSCLIHTGRKLKRINSIALEYRLSFFFFDSSGWLIGLCLGCCSSLFFETRSHIAHSSFKLTACLRLALNYRFSTSKCWGYRHVPPQITFKVVLNTFSNSGPLTCYTDGLRQGTNHPEAGRDMP